MFESMPDLERESDDEELQIEASTQEFDEHIEDPISALSLEMSPAMRYEEEHLSDDQASLIDETNSERHQMLTFETMSDSDDDENPVKDEENINTQIAEEYRVRTPALESSASESGSLKFEEENNNFDENLSDHEGTQYNSYQVLDLLFHLIFL